MTRAIAGRCCAAVLGLAVLPALAQDEVFEMSLEELLRVEIGSRVSSERDRQPVSVTTIDREQIRLSGARTLNELLMLMVPGFFLVEDQDDTIAAVRGLAPDNNSKLMLLLDGRSLNAEWFWGPPDALLNGLDLAFIERIEVIRGPGSVTQGQGALLGVVNLVTRRNPAASAGELRVEAGADGRGGASFGWEWVGQNQRQARIYLSDGEFEGQRIRNEGLARQVEQGLSVFERNHHLKRSDYRHLLASFETRHWSASAFRFQQRRDLYNWRRDREAVEQRLSGLHAGYRDTLGAGEFAADGYWHRDDYELSAHGGTRAGAARQIVPGLVMGGQREDRAGLRALWHIDGWLDRHRLAVGAEYNRYRFGQANFRGNNFLVNRQEDVLERGFAALNANNRWSLPGRVGIRSLFVEDYVRLGDEFGGFVAARWDAHPDWGSQLSPRLALLWYPDPNQVLRLSWQSGFRGAVGVHYSGGFEGDGLLREANFDAIEANPYFRANGSRNLQPVRPEEMTSIELAWRYDSGGRWRFDAVGFDNRVENVIGVGAYFLENAAARAAAIRSRSRIGDDLIGDWGGVFYFQNNPGRLRHRGVEAQVEFRDDERGLRLGLSHAYVDVVSADAGQFGPGNIYVTGTPADPQLRSFPQQVSRFSLRWQPPALGERWVLHYTQLSYPSWQPPGADLPRADGNLIGHVGVRWQPHALPGVELELQIKNIGNANALYPATSVAGEERGNQGVPALERRSAWLTLGWRF